MSRVRILEPYTDDAQNAIECSGVTCSGKLDINFGEGRNNRVTVAPGADVCDLVVKFTGDNGVVEIDTTSTKRTGLRFSLRVGHDSVISIGENVGCAASVFISATEGERVDVGRDVMFASGIEIRTDDVRGIYDVRTVRRLNPAQSITIGEHVWIAKYALILGGVSLGQGSVVGFRSIVTSSIPNNCIAVGSPARVVTRDIAWERPVTTVLRPGQGTKPKKRSERYWNLTVELPASQASGASSRRPAALSHTAAGAAVTLRQFVRRGASRLRREVRDRWAR